jgi:quercetin dioxygenase-like cupin family protein
MYKYPHTIENGHGEVLTFYRRVSTPNGERLEGDNVVKPGSGPPMHCHHFQEEGFTVMQGRLGYQVQGQPPKFAEVGDSVVFSAGVAHKFWSAGDVDLKCSAFVAPPDNVEFYLAGVFEAQKRGKGKRPEIFDAAFLARRYRSEFTMEEIPAVVRTFVFPLIVLVGTLLGKYRKFANAPEPRRS